MTDSDDSKENDSPAPQLGLPPGFESMHQDTHANPGDSTNHAFQFQQPSTERGLGNLDSEMPETAEIGEKSVSRSATLPVEIPGYTLVSKLGQGGMGSVYLARDEQLGRHVAIKVLKQSLQDDPKLLERFESEVQTLAGLQHDNIAQLFSSGSDNELSYFVMEYVDGQTLETYAKSPMNPQEVVELMRKVCSAIKVFHDQSILHRDLKPSNILMTQKGQPKIADFGLAKTITGDSSTTKTGEILGTPSYMAPEQASGIVKSLSTGCDIYAVGAIMYRLLTGRPPFDAEDPVQTVMMVISEDPLPPTKLIKTIPVDLETICLKCLQKDPKRRYLSIDQLVNDLQRYQTGVPILARPVSAAERVWKWSKRNPATAVSILSVFGLFAIGLFGLYIHSSRLTKELARTESLAEHGSALSAWIIEDHLEKLGKIPGTTKPRLELIAQVKQYLDNSYEDMPRDAKYTRRLGHSYSTLAGITGGSDPNNVSDFSEAEGQYMRALELYDLAEKQTDDRDAEKLTLVKKLKIETCLSLIDLYHEKNEPKKRENFMEQTKSLLAELETDDWESNFFEILLMEARIEDLMAANQHQEVLKLLDQIQAMLTRYEDKTDKTELENQRILVASKRGASLEALEKLEESKAAYQLAVDLAKKSYDEFPNDTLRGRRHASAQVLLGDILSTMHQMDDALKEYESALETISSLSDRDPDSIELLISKAQKYSRISFAHRYLKDLEKAESSIREAIKIHEELVKNGKGGVTIKQGLAVYLNSLADALVAKMDQPAAETALLKHRKLCEEMLESADNKTAIWRQLAENYYSNAVLLVFVWQGPSEPVESVRDSKEYNAVKQKFSESLRYLGLIDKEIGLDYHLKEYKNSVEAVQKVFEESVDQMEEKAKELANQNDL